MSIFFIIPELVIVAIIFGAWKLAYEKEKVIRESKCHTREDSLGLIVLALFITIAGVGAMIGIAEMATR